MIYQILDIKVISYLFSLIKIIKLNLAKIHIMQNKEFFLKLFSKSISKLTFKLIFELLLKLISKLKIYLLF